MCVTTESFFKFFIAKQMVLDQEFSPFAPQDRFMCACPWAQVMLRAHAWIQLSKVHRDLKTIESLYLDMTLNQTAENID